MSDDGEGVPDEPNTPALEEIGSDSTDERRGGADEDREEASTSGAAARAVVFEEEEEEEEEEVEARSQPWEPPSAPSAATRAVSHAPNARAAQATAPPPMVAVIPPSPPRIREHTVVSASMTRLALGGYPSSSRRLSRAIGLDELDDDDDVGLDERDDDVDEVRLEAHQAYLVEGPGDGIARAENGELARRTRDALGAEIEPYLLRADAAVGRTTMASYLDRTTMAATYHGRSAHGGHLINVTFARVNEELGMTLTLDSDFPLAGGRRVRVLVVTLIKPESEAEKLGVWLGDALVAAADPRGRRSMVNRSRETIISVLDRNAPGPKQFTFLRREAPTDDADQSARPRREDQRPPNPEDTGGFEALSDDLLLVAFLRAPFVTHGTLCVVCHRFKSLLRSDTFREQRLESGWAEHGIVFAGGVRNDRMVADCLMLSSGQWRPVPPLSGPRWGACSVVLDNEMWVMGGVDDGGRVLATVEVYSPKTNSWRSCMPMRQRRDVAIAGVVGGRVVVAGGWCRGDQLKSVEAYTGTGWVQLPPMPWSAGDATACVLNGRLHVMGSWGRSRLQVLEATGRDKFAWSVKADVPFPDMPPLDDLDDDDDGMPALEPIDFAREPATSVVKDGKILLIGGCAQQMSSVLVYDEDRNVWARGPPLPRREGREWIGGYAALNIGQDAEDHVILLHRDGCLTCRRDGEWTAWETPTPPVPLPLLFSAARLLLG